MSRREPGRPSSALVTLLEVLVVIGALLSRRQVARRATTGEPDALDLQMGYEHGDVRPAMILALGAALLVVMGIVLVVVSMFEVAVTGIPAGVSRPQELIQGLGGVAAPTPPAPRLEAQSGQGLAAYRAAETQKLTSYRWVDRQNGTVAIPIEQAMDLLAQQGLPTRAAPTETPRDQANRSPSRASSGRVDEAYP